MYREHPVRKVLVNLQRISDFVLFHPYEEIISDRHCITKGVRLWQQIVLVFIHLSF